jgi:hypothetical protein
MPSEAQAPKTNNKTLMIVLIIVGVIIVLGVGGCVAAGFIAKKAAQGIISGATGGAVKITGDNGSLKFSNGDATINSGDAAKWPSDMPAGVPKPTFGNITMSSKITSDNAWNVVLEKVTADNFASYKQTLVGAGWALDSETDFGVKIATYKKDTWELTMMLDTSSNGLSMNVLPQTK